MALHGLHSSLHAAWSADSLPDYDKKKWQMIEAAIYGAAVYGGGRYPVSVADCVSYLRSREQSEHVVSLLAHLDGMVN